MRRSMRVSGLAALCAACACFGNGVNPPQPRDSVVLKAVYTPRASEREVEVYRARVGNTESEGALIGSFDGVKQAIQVGPELTIEVPKGSANIDGYVSGRIGFKTAELRDGQLQVRTKNGNVRLVGFDARGWRIEMDLVKCRKVAFSTTSSYDPVYKDVKKK